MLSEIEMASFTKADLCSFHFCLSNGTKTNHTWEEEKDDLSCTVPNSPSPTCKYFIAYHSSIKIKLTKAWWLELPYGELLRLEHQGKHNLMPILK